LDVFVNSKNDTETLKASNPIESVIKKIPDLDKDLAKELKNIICKNLKTIKTHKSAITHAQTHYQCPNTTQYIAKFAQMTQTLAQWSCQKYGGTLLKNHKNLGVVKGLLKNISGNFWIGGRRDGEMCKSLMLQ